MTKEQEEAIENLTDLLKQRNEKQVQITTYNLFENIETVLSMLKENSAEIEQKNTELAEKNAEIEKKDKIIDLIAEFLEERNLGYYKNEIGGEILGIMRKYNKEDWKEYFEDKLNSSEQN